MQSALLILLSIVLFACIVSWVDALFGFYRRLKGIDEEAVSRRLSAAGFSKSEEQARVDILLARDKKGRRTWRDFVPFANYIARLILQSGTKMTAPQLIAIAAAISAAVTLLIVALAPAYFAILSIPFGLICGVAPVIFRLVQLRARRVSQFEEQLPEAIDLIVRSLKVGHPLTSAIGVIGREMMPPVSTEFTIAADQASYGKAIPRALEEMQERIPVKDLAYLVVAVQIQEESGGNLVESLAKLSSVIRERFRMFRKAKAITAEGRISAWLLSLFPFVIGAGLMAVKPDYYSQVMNYPLFKPLVLVTIILLGINILAMRILTTLRI